MRQPIIIKLFSALLNLGIFLLISVIILALHNWYQSGDTYSFIFWTIPLAAGLAISGGSILHFLKTPNGGLRIFLIFAIACLISLAWFYTDMAFWGALAWMCQVVMISLIKDGKSQSNNIIIKLNILKG